MKKTNLQIRVPIEIEAEIEALSPESKSDFVRQAIEEKIIRERTKRLEDEWIKALSHNSENNEKADDWFNVESWEE